MHSGPKIDHNRVSFVDVSGSNLYMYIILYKYVFAFVLSNMFQWYIKLLHFFYVYCFEDKYLEYELVTTVSVWE